MEDNSGAWKDEVKKMMGIHYVQKSTPLALCGNP
jgi:hypothetical protein